MSRHSPHCDCINDADGWMIRAQTAEAKVEALVYDAEVAERYANGLRTENIRLQALIDHQTSVMNDQTRAIAEFLA